MSGDYIVKPKIGAIIKGRIVTPQDIESWKQQRIQRKSKTVKLDPYR